MHRHNSLSLDVKMDWCDTTVNGQKVDPHIVYKNMVSDLSRGFMHFMTSILLCLIFKSNALNATNKKIWLNSCEWGVDNPWEWMRKYANSWRTTHDHHDEWGSTARAIEANADLGKYAGKKSFVEND